MTAYNLGPLVLIQEVPLDPNICGRLDHLTIGGQHLFLSCLGNDSVEVIDTFKGRACDSFDGFNTPQGILFVNDCKKLYIGTREGQLHIYDSSPFNKRSVIDFGDEVDNLRFCEISQQVFVGYGDGAIGIVDVATDTLLEMKYELNDHPESFQLESNGHRLFVNVADSKEVVIIDRTSGQTITTKLPEDYSSNFPLCIDEISEVLFVGVRSPPRLVVLDMNSGVVLVSYPCCSDSDDIFFDAHRKRVYVIGGDGCICTFMQCNRGKYEELPRVISAVGARTGIWHTGRDRLYVAAPKTTIHTARLLVYAPQ